MMHYSQTKGERREKRRRKKRTMRVSGKSVKLLMRLAMKRADTAVPETGTTPATHPEPPR